MKKEIEEFLYHFNAINEVEYGDFMRKTNNYLTIFSDKIFFESDARIKNLLNELKKDILYYSNWDIASSRQRTLAIMEKINNIAEENKRIQPFRNHPSLTLVANNT